MSITTASTNPIKPAIITIPTNLSAEYEFKLNINLLDSIRGFKHANHQYTDNYIQTLLATLFALKLNLTDKTSVFNGVTNLQLYLAVHFGLANSINLNNFIHIHHKDIQIKDLKLDQVNSTNLFNLHSLYAALRNAMKELKKPPSLDLVGELINLDQITIRITNAEKSEKSSTNNMLIFPADMVKLYISARGKYNIYFTSYMASEINRVYKLNLYYYIFEESQSQNLTENFSDGALTIMNTTRSIFFTQEDFVKCVKAFNHTKDVTKLIDMVPDIEHILYYSIYSQNKENLDLLERLFIGLLGHPFLEIRDKATLYLNIIYDGIDWQLRGAYKPRISKVGDEFKIEYLIESDEDDDKLLLLLNSYSLDPNDLQSTSMISFHKPRIIPFDDTLSGFHSQQGLSTYNSSGNLTNISPEKPHSMGDSGALSVSTSSINTMATSNISSQSNMKYVIVSVNLGKFSRSGFYDWKFVKLQKGGKIAGVYTQVRNLNTMSVENLLDRSMLEEYKTKAIQGRFIIHPENVRDMEIHEIFLDYPDGLPGDFYRGTFKKVKESINNYAKSGVNCLYLVGAFERDYGVQENPKTHEKVPKKKDVCPMAITDRRAINTMLGGSEEFKSLIKIAKDRKVEVIVDWVARVSAYHAHKRYRNLLVYQIDDEGRRNVCYGCDGRAWNHQDTAYLNYRKKEAWDLLVDEAIEFIKEYKVDGLHLDNGQTWPNIFALNLEELLRKESDGGNAYGEEEIFYGDIINPNQASGYWTTDAQEKLPNPLYIKLIKALWQNFPNCKIISEVWGGQGYENRDITIARSGAIPRLFKLPPALATVHGFHLSSNGELKSCEKQTLNAFRSWYEDSRKYFPSGAVLIESSTYNPWPYPTLLYKRGAWSAIDVLFFLPGIPMTFMNEIDGQGYRTNTLRYFQRKLIENKETFTKGKEVQVKVTFETDNSGDQPSGNVKITSSMSEKLSINDIWSSEEALIRDIGPEYGFDTRKIQLHYEHRRMLRNNHAVLRYGSMVSLLAEHSEGLHSNVLSFARVLKEEIAIIATNFNDFSVHFSINMKNLKFLFDDIESDLLETTVVQIQDLLGSAFDDYYTMYEFLNGRIGTSLKQQASLIWMAKIISGDKELHEKTLARSMERIKYKLARNQLIDGSEIASLITNLVHSTNKVQEFASNIGYISKKFLKPHNIQLPLLLNSIKEFKDDPSLSAKLFAFCHILNEISKNKTASKDKNVTSDSILNTPDTQINKELNVEAEKLKSEPQSLSPIRKASVQIDNTFQFVKEILAFNKLGPIAFVTPELGRWSTMGGLGVMVDELSIGLVELGEEVICVSPYYERNRKGETGYLERDPDNIQYYRNLDILLGDGTYTVGVHRGVVKGVQVYFLHNPVIFPQPYADGDARFTMQQLALMAKASLEVFCETKKIPSVIVTNDWFTALVPAYPKNGHFGEVFKGTKFFHIVHNLEPTYEGRIYPNPNEGYLEFVHKLPTHLFVDPYWTAKVINPSRCAIISSDQWGTVSPSYRNDLLKDSPLATLLKAHPQPFAFPNGIPKDARLQKIIQICGNDHLKAKERLQKKYFKANELDDTVALCAFVGRITQQKGVHLILESAETLINKYKGKIQILVGGPANLKEPYGSYCASMMSELNRKFSYNFWSAPSEFFMDGSLVNVGADFGLMPSLFEPGGIVQHEFFIGSTPVIAFRTGGLKDTVIEFDPRIDKGNGFNFQDHKVGDFMYAVERAIQLFTTNKEKYLILRRNAFESTIDGAEVSRAWDKEFHRLFNKTFVDTKFFKEHMNLMEKTWDDFTYEDKLTISLKKVVNKETRSLKNVHHKSHYMKAKGNFKNHIFTYKTSKLPKPKSIMVIGSFDAWKGKYSMNYDHIMDRWNITLALMPGEYFYKFIVDDEWVCSDEDPKINDINGNVNNYLKI